MIDRFFYFITTFAEAGLAVFGLRGLYEQPAYSVRAALGNGLEIRDYPPSVAVQTSVVGPTREQAANAAFGLLFRYIAGDNEGGRTIAMTSPVRQDSALIAMTTPVRTDAAAEDGQVRVTMRFFLPARHAANPPAPRNPQLALATLPAVTVAALRFSGTATDSVRAAKGAELLARLATTEWRAAGEPYFLGYDPPFTIPMLKRNEVAVALAQASVDAGG